jgi:hypothetical protein
VVCVVIGLRLLLGREEIELIVGLMTASARQLLEDGVQTYLSVVDLRGQRIALRLQCGAFFASLFEFYAGRFAFGARLCELFFECEARFVIALADLDQPADVLLQCFEFGEHVLRPLKTWHSSAECRTLGHLSRFRT